jgi:hypothetical protein
MIQKCKRSRPVSCRGDYRSGSLLALADGVIPPVRLVEPLSFVTDVADIRTEPVGATRPKENSPFMLPHLHADAAIRSHYIPASVEAGFGRNPGLCVNSFNRPGNVSGLGSNDSADVRDWKAHAG